MLGRLLRNNLKWAAIFSFLIAIVCLILLAGSLDGLVLNPGQPFPASQGGTATAEPAGRPGFALPAATPVFSGLAALVLLGLIIYLPTVILRAVNFVDMTVPLLVLAVVLGLAFSLQWLGPTAQSSAPTSPGQIDLPRSFDYPLSPIGNPPPYFEYLVMAGAFIIGAVALFAVYRSRPKGDSSDDPVLQEARRGAKALDEGVAWQSVIIRCYAEMCRRLLLEQGLERKSSMTVREFEELLASRGIPFEPVHELTALFEQARYDSKNESGHEEARARTSLDQIVQHFEKVQV